MHLAIDSLADAKQLTDDGFEAVASFHEWRKRAKRSADPRPDPT